MIKTLTCLIQSPTNREYKIEHSQTPDGGAPGEEGVRGSHSEQRQRYDEVGLLGESESGEENVDFVHVLSGLWWGLQSHLYITVHTHKHIGQCILYDIIWLVFDDLSGTVTRAPPADERSHWSAEETTCSAQRHGERQLLHADVQAIAHVRDRGVLDRMRHALKHGAPYVL